LNDLVTLKGKEVFTDSWIIAEGTQNKHISIKELINDYRNDFIELGTISVLNRESTGGMPEQYYLLNEEQAAFLMTLLRNNPIVVQFKKELVRQFYAMRRLLLEQQSSEWKFFRQQGKTVRLAETDTLKELVEYAKSRGSTNYNKIYGNYTRLANKTVGIRSIKDATTMQLNYLILVENIFKQIIRSGMDADRKYHDIYQDCKEKAIQLSNAVNIGMTA
jgi:phage regulator Rha-like protein